jgi:outer membrane lipoprotein
MRRLLALVIALLLSGCATPSIPLQGTDKSLTPDSAVAAIDTARGQRAAWGGTIVNTRNLKDTTEIEVLGFPLGSDARPDPNATAQHRFLLLRAGYLEPADYRSGRLVSVVGAVEGTRDGTVGEAPYVYPVLQAEQVYLWPLDEGTRSGSNIHFGIGIIFGR